MLEAQSAVWEGFCECWPPHRFTVTTSSTVLLSSFHDSPRGAGDDKGDFGCLVDSRLDFGSGVYNLFRGQLSGI